MTSTGQVLEAAAIQHRRECDLAAAQEEIAALKQRVAAAEAPASTRTGTVVEGEEEEQLLELTKITEELTDALEAARLGEERACRKLREVEAQLDEERRRSRVREQELADAKVGREEGLATLRALEARITAQEKQAAGGFRTQATRLEEAIAEKGRSLKYPHFEV